MKVILHKLFPYAPYLNEYIGFEIEVHEKFDGSDTEQLALQTTEQLRRLAEQAHRERYPNLYATGQESLIETFSSPNQQPLPTIDYSSKERTEQAIQDCKTPHELDLLMGDIAKHQLVPQYLEKKKSLK